MFTFRQLIELSLVFFISTIGLTLVGVLLDKLVLGPPVGESVLFRHHGGLLIMALAGLITWKAAKSRLLK
jgi:hypothetical protein